MALKSLTDDGQMEWDCHNGCGLQQAHVSHSLVEWSGMPGAPLHHHTIALPPCPTCGSRMFLKAHFNEQELQAPNMWQPWMGAHEDRLRLLQQIQAMGRLPDEFARAGYTMPLLKAEIAQLAAMKAAGGMPTPSRAVAERHMQLVGHMDKAGKMPLTE